MPQGSALLRAIHGPDADLTYSDHLQRMEVYELRIANWQRSGDKKARRPAPPETPGDLQKVEQGISHKQNLVRRLRAKLKQKQKQKEAPNVSRAGDRLRQPGPIS